ncbi:MAG: permease-like cell division protein FtsX [Anaplasmataceae bacterium]|nr:permease-like cell division protein FtsX [Anaplasmataceae bacterium]
MLTVISRVFQFGWKNFMRNGLLTTTTVAIITISLTVFLYLILLNVLMDSTVATLEDKIDITVSFKTITPEDEILNIQRSLQTLNEVREVAYISQTEALEIFKERHAGDEAIIQALREIGDNPLEASLNIKANRPDQYAQIAAYFENPVLGRYISNVSYAENQVVIDRLTSIISNINRIGFMATVVLVLVAGLVVFNTIRLAIYASREEIGIMRAVGASNSFVRGPFVVQGIISGAIAAIFSLFIAIPSVYSVNPYIAQAIPEFDIFRYFLTHIHLLFIYLLLAGVIVSGFSSFIAVRRYLHG